MTKKEIRKSNELKVIALLNDMHNTSLEHSEERYGEHCEFDAFGTSDGVDVLIEVKERTTDYAKPLIQEDKLRSLFAFAKKRKEKTGNDVGVYLINSLPEGEHLVYDCREIWTLGRKGVRSLPSTTDWDQRKVDKNVVYFDKNEYMLNLTDMSLGYKYEHVEDLLSQTQQTQTQTI